LVGYAAAFPCDLPDIPYYTCFRKVVEQIARWANWGIPRGIAKVTFDRNYKVAYNAAAIYSYLANAPPHE